MQCLGGIRGSANTVCCCSSFDVLRRSQNQQHVFGFTEEPLNIIQSAQNIWE